jgi:hypothetical protein
VEQFKWNYVLEKEEDDDTDADDEDNEAAIDKDDDDDSYTDDDDDNVSSTTMSIKKRKYDIITSSGDGDTSKPDMAKSYPHLSQALGGGDDGFDPVDPSVRRSMHSLLRELNDLLSTEYRLDVSGISNHRISYVRVPRTKSNSSFRNSKEWLDTAIEISGSKHGGTFESAYRITNHIIRYYHDSFLAACETQRVPVCNPMSATEEGGLVCEFSKDTCSMHSHLVDMYIPGDLAFQAMALGKESMSGWWCMLCKPSRKQFLDEQSKMWTMDELVSCGMNAESSDKEPLLGIKQRPWWPFIPLTKYVTPLLHCEIGIGNDLFTMLRNIINEHIETYAPGEEAIRRAIPALKQVIKETTAMRDSWDSSDDGKQLKTLTRTVAAYKRQWEETSISAGEKTNVEDERERTHILDRSKLKALQDFRKRTFADKLQKARQTLADQQSKLKEMRRAKVRRQHSIETQLF